MNESGWFGIDCGHSSYFAANWALFQKRYSETAEMVHMHIAHLENYQFQQIAEGRFTIREKRGNQLLYTSSHFSGQLQKDFSRIMASYERGAKLIVVAGSGLGYLVAHAEESIRGKLQYGLLVLENRPELIAAQFCLLDCRSLIRSNQVFWAVDESLLRAVHALFDPGPLECVPSDGVIAIPERCLSEDERRQIQTVGAWVSNFTRMQSSIRKQAEIDFWQRVQQPANLQNGRVWSIATPDAYAHTPLIRALLQGFEELGWHSHLLEIRDGFGTSPRVNHNLLSQCPDLLLLCNTASGTFIRDTIPRPRISWLLDHPRLFAANTLKNNLTSKDFVFYLDRSYTGDLKDMPAASCQFLPATACITHQGERKDGFVAPILFVGSYQDAGDFYQRLTPSQREEIHLLLDEQIQHPLQTSRDALAKFDLSQPVSQLIREKSLTFSEHIRERLPSETDRIDYFLYSLANSWKREQAVSALLDLGIVIYGPPTWKSLLGERYAGQFRGWLSSDDLADVYASAEIVLNLHSLQCPTCLNPRDFDVLAARGCLLSDWVEDFDLGFLQPNSDCAVFRNLTELREKAEWLLHDPEQRQCLREQGHATYLSKHTPRHRAQEMLRVIQEKYRNFTES